MPLSYEKIKQEHEHGISFWASFSNIALVIAILFLVLYTVTVLRSASLQSSEKINTRKHQEQISELKRKLAGFEAGLEILKKDAAEKEATVTKLTAQLETEKRDLSLTLEGLRKRAGTDGANKKKILKEMTRHRELTALRLTKLREKNEAAKAESGAATKRVEARVKGLPEEEE